MRHATFKLILAAFIAVTGIGLANAQDQAPRGDQDNQAGNDRNRNDDQRGGRRFQDRPDGRGDAFPGPGGPPQDGPPMPGPSPLVAALDENADGEISASEIEQAATSLKELDENTDGKLTENEIRPRGPGPRGGGDRREGPDGPGPGPGGPQGLGQGGRDPGQMIERLKQADTNGDGKISKDEAPERLQANFERLDQDSDGFLGEDEIRRLADRGGGRRGPGGPPDGPPGPEGRGGGGGGGIGSPEGFLDRLFQFDSNGDGNLTREELSEMAKRFGGLGGRGDRPDQPAEGQGESRPRRPQRPEGGRD